MHRPVAELSLVLFLLALCPAGALADPAVTASSATTEGPAARAYDQDKGSRWSSEFSDPQWIEIDLGAEKDLVGLILFWELAYGSSYEVLCSTDRQAWTRVFQTDQGDGGTDDLVFERTRARFVKISCTRRGTGWGYSLFEVVPKTAAAPWGEGEVPDLYLLGESTRVFVPAAWSNEQPGLRLTGYRNACNIAVNGQAVARLEGTEPRRRVDLGATLQYDRFNEISVRSEGPEPHASAILVAHDRALPQGLQQMRARDAKTAFELVARIEPEGFFPYFLTGQQGYWTVVGAPGDFKESLFGEDGTVEPYKSFSIAPFLTMGGVLRTRADVQLTQSLERGHLPLPHVQWKGDGFELSIRAFAAGSPGKSTTYVSYEVRNTGSGILTGQLHLAIRPFEVNPPWQWGGLHRVPEIRFKRRHRVCERLLRHQPRAGQPVPRVQRRCAGDRAGPGGRAAAGPGARGQRVHLRGSFVRPQRAGGWSDQHLDCDSPVSGRAAGTRPGCACARGGGPVGGGAR
jgi:hypothetical protein